MIEASVPAARSDTADTVTFALGHFGCFIDSIPERLYCVGSQDSGNITTHNYLPFRVALGIVLESSLTRATLGRGGGVSHPLFFLIYAKPMEISTPNLRYLSSHQFYTLCANKNFVPTIGWPQMTSEWRCPIDFDAK